MPTIYIDNSPYEVDEGQNLLHACLSLGFDIPHFCWHPALDSVGACRQCAVKEFKDENDKRGRIVMSCMTPATHGIRISIDDPEVKKFRASVIEWLMLNHPHDCPVCDEGGECHLQDMTVMTGHVYRRNRFKKRTFRNQNLSPFLHHEMNRCIQCYRCVRFYRDLAGGRDFHVYGVHDRVYFGGFADGPLESEFSGNLAEICPTGVFTDATFRKHFTRKWDLQTAPSICPHCGLGCDTIAAERYGTLRRVRNRYNDEVNGYFLCDRGRFGYEYVNSDRRLRRPLRRTGSAAQAEELSGEQALDMAASMVSSANGVIGIGSPRASLESNFALKRLVGEENFSTGLCSREQALINKAVGILKGGPARSASLKDAARADAIFILGEDVTNTGPLMALSLRRAARLPFMHEVDRRKVERWNAQMVMQVTRDRKGPFFVATPFETKLDSLALHTFRGAPQDIARLGFAVANSLDPDSAGPEGLDKEARDLARSIADSLGASQNPLIVSGVSCGTEAVPEAAANIGRALCKRQIAASLAFILPECDSAGSAILGGLALEDAAEALRNGKADTLIIVENDLYRRMNPADASRLLGSAKRVIALDHIHQRTSDAAHVALPSGTFVESDGTVVNSEGRAQRFYQVYPAEDPIQSSWEWIRDLMGKLGRPEGAAWNNWDGLLKSMERDVDALAPMADKAPLPADYTVHGQKIPRQPHRYSGRTAMVANRTVHEPRPPEDRDSALAFSMEGLLRIEDAPLIPRYWAPGWNSVQAVNKFQKEVCGPLRVGETGRRLIEPKDTDGAGYFTRCPEPFKALAGQWLAVPAPRIFGSEELSSLSPPVALRAPDPFIGLHPADAEDAGLSDGDKALLAIGDESYPLTVRFTAGLPRGVAALSALADFVETEGWVSAAPPGKGPSARRLLWNKR